MDMFVVHGGRPLTGRVAVGGAKNAALPIMAAAILADGATTLHGVPDLVDVTTMADLLRTLGLQVTQSDDLPIASSLRLEVRDASPIVAHYELVRRMRAGVCVLGPLLAKRGRAVVSLPGGCNIGDRPIDLHLKGLRALGAEIRIERGYIIAEAKRLTGTHIDLSGPFGSTVTGTCNVMTAAALADGTTVIESAASEPEVVDLGRFLVGMGARISGLGTSQIEIEGVDRLRGAEHAVIPDRIEAATLLIAAAITAGTVTIENVRVDHLSAVIEKLREAGVVIETRSTSESRGQRSEVGGRRSDQPAPLTINDPVDLTVTAAARLRAVDAVARPYPGIPTDVQAQLMALLCVAEGRSVITDRVFPDRYLHAAELCRMGAAIRRDGAAAIVSGVPRLSGACVMASDLRASAALVLAALNADGATAVKRIYHLDRGYARFEEKLAALGADVRRVKDLPENLPASLVVPHAAPPIPEPHFPALPVAKSAPPQVAEFARIQPDARR
jgi:UDP-N-acetylglucosamine 1-carboxyvinyltransferase